MKTRATATHEAEEQLALAEVDLDGPWASEPFDPMHAGPSIRRFVELP